MVSGVIGKVLTPNGVIENGFVAFKDGKISGIGSIDDLIHPELEGFISATGKWVLPGFIDLHCHGGKGSDVMDGTLSDIEVISSYHSGGGTTAFLPTTASSSIENILGALKVIREARRTKLPGAKVLGAHIEGPFFSYAKRGCHLPIYVRNPRPEEYEKILEYSDDIASMTFAPELDGAEELVKALVENGIIASIGHSDASYEQVLKAVKWGATHVTHIYCAMSTVIKNGPQRIAGVVESTLLLDDLTTEIIADGKHLPVELIKLVLKAKGIDKVCVVTDAMRGAGMPSGVYTFGPKDGQPALVQDGMAIMPDRSGYASSVVRMNDLLRTMVDAVGLSLPEAVKMASYVPAKIIHMDDKLGSIETGKDADVVIMDDHFNVLTTIVNGEKVFDSGNGDGQ